MLHRLAISVSRLKLCIMLLQNTVICIHVYHKDKSPWIWSVSLLISHDARKAYPWKAHIINTCGKLSLMLLHMIFDHSARSTINSQFIFQMHRLQSAEAPQSDAAFLIRAFFFFSFFKIQAKPTFCRCASNSNQVSICLGFTKQPFIFAARRGRKKNRAF